MEHMVITQAVYVRGLADIGQEVGEVYAIMIVVDGQEMSIPLDPANRHYAEILRQVEAGELIIEEAAE